MRSMTGFGRGSAAGDGLEVRCEVKSVNHRGLDVRVRADRELASLEHDVGATVRSFFERGRFDVALLLERRTARPPVRFDNEAAARVVDDVLAFARARDDVEPRLSAGQLLARADLFVVEDLGKERAELLERLTRDAVAAATRDLDAARAREGDGLAAELDERLASCAALVEAIDSRSTGAPERLRDKLAARMRDAEVQLDPGRLAQEAALLADRVDVSEELARLRLHLAHFRDVARGEGSVGRKLDFLCQELTREANTVGSKCSDAETAHRVVELKAEIERIREQSQNVE